LSGRKRIARLNEQLKREISELIQRQVRDPRIGQVTITGVDLARDLGSAKVYIRSPGKSEEIASTLEGLGAAAPFLRTALGRILSVRRVPELRFRTDRSYEHAQRIEQVLSEVMPPEEAPEPDADG
jgi:ribosome-binding factor A